MIFGVLAAVAVFMAFYPKRPEFFLFRLSKSFGTDRRPSDYGFEHEWFYVRSALERGRLDGFFPWQYAHFDVELDIEGIWMSFIGPDPEKCAPSILVPWRQIKFVRHWQKNSYFTFLADEPVGITVRKSLGEAMARYIAPWH